jgi:serine/threonine protein kinase
MVVDAIVVRSAIMTPRSELPAGTVIGPYVVERKAGQGAFGAVYAARRDGGDADHYALKMLLDSVVGDPEQVERFKREAAFLSRVTSQHVARMHEFFVDPAHGMILVMEFVEGELLSDLLDAGRLTLEEAMELGFHLLLGLRDLHDAKIVHRDIKPANVMIRRLPSGGHRAVIFDLGLSRALQGGTDPERSLMSITGASMALGTLQYMSPEQVINARQATERSDLYAVGSILYRAVSGMEPFEGDERTIARQKLMEEARTYDIGRSDPLAEGLRAFIAKSMRRRPAQRFQTAAEMFEALEEVRRVAAGWGTGERLSYEEKSYRAQLPTLMGGDAPSTSALRSLVESAALSQPALPMPELPPERRSSAPWIALLLALLAAAGFAGWFFLGHQR